MIRPVNCNARSTLGVCNLAMLFRFVMVNPEIKQFVLIGGSAKVKAVFSGL